MLHSFGSSVKQPPDLSRLFCFKSQYHTLCSAIPKCTQFRAHHLYQFLPLCPCSAMLSSWKALPPLLLLISPLTALKSRTGWCHLLKEASPRSAWVAQSVTCPTSAQVMISWFVSVSPTSGSVLTARSPEPASDSVSPSLSLPLPCSCCLSLSQK